MHREGIAEKYVSGRLSEEAREDFEAHYFDCDTCFQEVQALRAAKEALALTGRAERSRKWFWALPIAAALLLSFLFFKPHAPAREAAAVQAPADKYSALAHFDPPQWKPVTYRGQNSEAHDAFVAAMSRYQAHDYTGCGVALSAIDLTEARFYEGLCWMLSGHDAAGSSALRKTIDAGDTPYLEEARFYLAKSLIGRDNFASARAELEKVVALHGDLERQAADLLGRLPAKP